jgi:hypothetical protein
MKRYEVTFIEKVYHFAVIVAENEKEAVKAAREALTYGDEPFYQQSNSIEYCDTEELEQDNYSFNPMFDMEGTYLGKDTEQNDITKGKNNEVSKE